MAELQGPRVAGPVWPPRPADSDKSAKFSCQAAGRRLVIYEICTSICTSVAKNRACGGCPCPWRVCTACAVQRDFSNEIRDVDPSSGMCKFHTDNGASAVRKNLEEETIDIRLRPVRPPVLEDPDDDDEPESVLVLPDEDELKRIAGMLNEMNQNRLQIASMLSLGSSLKEIAHASETTRDSISATILAMGNNMRLDYPPECPVSKVEYYSRVLGAAYPFVGT